MVCSEQLGISFVLLQPTFTLSILRSVIHYQRGVIDGARDLLSFFGGI